MEKTAHAFLPTEFGDFEVITFGGTSDFYPHLVLGRRAATALPTLVRIHSECMTGDVFGSQKCDCGFQLKQSLKMIAQEGGYLIYLRQEGRGIGLTEKIKAYALQEQGADTIEANLALGHSEDARDYQVAVDILKMLQIEQLRLITNNPLKEAALRSNGIIITETIHISSPRNPHNELYLDTKKNKMGHAL
jgi:GTP cyclohydrolase II